VIKNIDALVSDLEKVSREYQAFLREREPIITILDTDGSVIVHIYKPKKKRWRRRKD
jgi:hypothetical protein